VSVSASDKKGNESLEQTLIVGVGNSLLGDEGIGPHIIDNLLQLPMPPGVRLLDCGCDLLNLVSYIDEPAVRLAGKPKKIIVVDAIRAGGKPGEIHRFDFAELEVLQTKTRSAHQLQVVDALRLLREVCPCLTNCEITVIGIEPKVIELSTDFSTEVRQNIPDLTRLVLEEMYSVRRFAHCEVNHGKCENHGR
jgi:hydrogenase maturation protease